MKKSLFKVAMAVPLLSLAFSAYASDATDALTQVLKERYPTTTFSEVNETQVQGLYELVAGKNIFYTDSSGKYLFFGSLYDMENSRDITQERRANMNRVSFDELKLADAIKEVKGDGSRVVAVFTDPDCPYCRQLEATLAEMKDITIYRFLYPLTSIHPGADKVSAQVWCAGPDDSVRMAALGSYMLKGATPANAGACETPVDRNVALGKKFGINGTPTLIAADGRMHPGSAGLASLEAWLSGTNAGGKAIQLSN